MSDPRDHGLVPHVTTARLLLREPRKTDFETYHQAMSDPEMTRHLPSMPSDRRNSWRVFTSLLGQWAMMDAGWWLVELHETRQIVGIVGAFFREGAIGRERDVDIELGWSVFTAHQRRGYATEAARAALTWAFANHPSARAVAYVDASNVASARVAEGIGMKREGEVDFYGERVPRFAVDRPG